MSDNQLSTTAKNYTTIKDMVDSMMPELMKALPKHIKPDRVARVWLNEVRKNPKLASCTKNSLAGAFMLSAQLGLEPGPLQHCYLIPFNNRKANCVEVEFQIGYQGYIELGRRSGLLTTITVQTVYENDEFTYQYGSDQHLKHIPKMGDRGKPIGFYCFTKLNTGEESFTILSVHDVEKHRDRFTKSRDFKTKQITGPWKDDFEAMSKKTAIKQHFKYMPLSLELQAEISKDEIVVDSQGNEFRIDELKDVSPARRELQRPNMPSESTNNDYPDEEPPEEPEQQEPAIERDYEGEYTQLAKLMTKKNWEEFNKNTDGVKWEDVHDVPDGQPYGRGWFLDEMKRAIEGR